MNIHHLDAEIQYLDSTKSIPEVKESTEFLVTELALQTRASCMLMLSKNRLF